MHAFASNKTRRSTVYVKTKTKAMTVERESHGRHEIKSSTREMVECFTWRAENEKCARVFHHLENICAIVDDPCCGATTMTKHQIEKAEKKLQENCVDFVVVVFSTAFVHQIE